MLAPNQLTAIDQHLRTENWLLNEDLIAELTDHYINGISERMTHGMTFDVALREIHSGFGSRKGLLKMEENFQVQKARQLNLVEWQTIRSLVEGSRWFITVAIFACLYTVNVFLGQREIVHSAFGFGTFLVTFSVLMRVVQTGVFFYQNRRELNVAVTLPSSPVFIGSYCLSLSLVLLNKYILPKYALTLPDSWILVLETSLETLCIVYYIAITLCIRQMLWPNHNLKKI